MSRPVNLARVIRSMGRPRTFFRPGATTYVDGVAAEGSGHHFKLRAIIQPARGVDMESLPGGRRTEGTLRVDVLCPGLRSEQVGDNAFGALRGSDQFDYGPGTYEVITEFEWQDEANYQSLLAQRVEDP